MNEVMLAPTKILPTKGLLPLKLDAFWENIFIDIIWLLTNGIYVYFRLLKLKGSAVVWGYFLTWIAIILC